MENERQPTAKESHDAQLARKNGWVNDLHTASALWVLERDGVPILKEYGDCDCKEKAEVHPEAHLSRISDWPGAFVPEQVTVMVNGEPTLENYWVASEKFEPFTLRAVPETLSHQSLPEASYKIEEGMKVIWTHRIQTARHDGGTGHQEAMVVGRVLPSGDEEVTKIYPDGSKFEHDSYQDALAHSN